jgi:quinol-cytochrome oxidoreductase complex cytochrome b subunit
MIYLGILFCLALLGGVISVAFNKKSNFPTRVASLIALALMVLAIIICLVVAFTDHTVAVDESVLIVGAPLEVKKTGNDNTMILVLLIIFLIVFFVAITVLTIKEHKKINVKKQDSLSSIL